MKNSGIEWIGEIPKHWTYSKLKYELISCDGGVWGNDPIEDSVQNKIVIRSTEQTVDGKWCIVEPAQRDLNGINNLHAFKILKGDLLMTKSSGSALHIGKTSLADNYFLENECYYSNFIQRIRTKAFPKYIWYILNSPLSREQFVYLQNSTSGIGNINAENICNIFIPVPNHAEQKNIVATLDEKCGKIDELIANQQAQIEKLKEYKQSVITEAVTKGIHTNVCLRKNSVRWIGDTPAHWSIVRLKHIYDYSNGSPVRVGPFGSALSGSDIVNEGVWVYNQRTVLDNNFETNNTFVSEEKALELSGFAVYPKDILITTRGSIGKTTIVPDGAPYGILHPCVIRFRINENKMNNELLSIIFNETNICLGQIMDMSNSTTIEVLYSYSLKEIWVPCPPMEEQETILHHVRNQIEKFNRLTAIKQEKIQKLEEYKKSLIYEYVTGKKEVV